MKKSLLFTAAMLLAATASAFHPMSTEDTALLGKDVRQIEAGLEHTVERDGADTYSTSASATLSYGLFRNLDVMVTVPWEGWSSHGISESGLGDVSIEGKFGAGKRSGWDLVLKPGFSLPAGNENRSLGAGKGGVWVYGVAGREAGPGEIFLNAGFMLNRNSFDEEENIFKFSAMGVAGVLPNLSAAVEFAAETNSDREASDHPLSTLVGVIWSPYPTLDLDFGARFGLNRAADDLSLLAGLTLRL